ncbi:hypothetical protein FB451DRAFT_1274316 [Mycena latifolia]|nr:hypothetical protein FB451DRAFT_1274316 [Mycena latifolia]
MKTQRFSIPGRRYSFPSDTDSYLPVRSPTVQIAAGRGPRPPSPIASMVLRSGIPCGRTPPMPLRLQFHEDAQSISPWSRRTGRRSTLTHAIAAAAGEQATAVERQKGQLFDLRVRCHDSGWRSGWMAPYSAADSQARRASLFLSLPRTKFAAPSIFCDICPLGGGNLSSSFSARRHHPDTDTGADPRLAGPTRPAPIQFRILFIFG